MKQIQLGNTNTFVSIIGQGTMGFGGYFDYDPSDDQGCIRALRYGLDCGMSFVDTAEVYGKGHSEELIGEAFKHNRKDVFIATKVSPENLSKKDVMTSAEASLKRLGTDVIDLYQVHWPNPSIPMEDTAEALNLLMKQGKVRYIGVSNFSTVELIKFKKYCPIVSAQSEFNLFDRTVEKSLLPFCQRSDITFIAYTPLDRPQNFPVIQEIADKHNATLSQVSLGWLTKNPGVMAIPKAKQKDHIEENSKIISLDDEDISLLNQSKIEPIHISADEIICDDKNLEKYVPGYKELGLSFLKGVTMKPVRAEKKNGKYYLTEGKIRYWAWRYAYGNKPCPVLLR